MSTIICETDDGHIYREAVTYEACRNGTPLSESVVTNASVLRIGQAELVGGFGLYQTQFRFDTSGIEGGIENIGFIANLNPAVDTYTGVTDVVELRVYPGMQTPIEWLNGDDFASETTLVGTANLSNGSGIGEWTIDEETLIPLINLAGFTNFVMATRRFVEGTEPSGDDSWRIQSADDDSDELAPRLVVTTASVTLTGAQGAPSGTVSAAIPISGTQGEPSGTVTELRTTSIGVQPSPSGRLFTSQLKLRGTQPRPSGQLRGILSDADSGGTLDYVILGAGSTDLGFFSGAATYNAARTGAGTEWPLSSLPVGQLYIAPDTYQCFQAHFEFPTSLLPAGKVIVAPRFTIRTNLTYTGDPDVFELRAATIGSWIAGADIDSQTTLIATAPTGSNPTFTVDRDALEAALDPSMTGFVLITRRFRLGIAPSKEGDYLQFNNHENDATLFAPRLTLPYTDVLIGGTQGLPSGRTITKTNALTQGRQDRPSGFVENTNRIPLTGTQGNPSGTVTLATQRRTVLPRGRAQSRTLPKGRTNTRRTGSL